MAQKNSKATLQTAICDKKWRVKNRGISKKGNELEQEFKSREEDGTFLENLKVKILKQTSTTVAQYSDEMKSQNKNCKSNAIYHFHSLRSHRNFEIK